MVSAGKALCGAGAAAAEEVGVPLVAGGEEVVGGKVGPGGYRAKPLVGPCGTLAGSLAAASHCAVTCSLLVSGTGAVAASMALGG